ncbi:polyphosphate polymerase domain-containing protein [Echinicola sp. CAU 1574]|uniref:Polyphosphate polymerase domain-containing protein n=1 Tax=Echinicola arenosa TaxID=2774144 RepID=A0ABR9AMJ5_9BACT|nr:polyphosphate polymerase domain-containing protein [Echinicola arenosa]MBD8489078.1 polyphosphate polymerase domain-containing protein [Echinicola arenosa]
MKLRHEKKYLVPTECLDQLRARLIPFLRPDLYTSLDPLGIPEYKVRSIYFDSHTNSSFFEKVEGLKDRKKLRVRGYGLQEKGSQVVLEIKRKISDRVMKNRAFIPYSEVENVILKGLIDKNLTEVNKESRENIVRFLFNIKRYNLKPENLIVYNREAYHGKFDSGIRVTFDKNIRQKSSPVLRNLFSDFGLNPIWKGYFILEIKYFDSTMPSWAKSIIEEFKLKNEALSKYATGVEYSLENF